MLGIILATVGGGIAGFAIGNSILGCVIGIVIGGGLGLLSSILFFGLFATILQISATLSEINQKLKPSVQDGKTEKSVE